MIKHDSPINFFLFYAANFFFSAAYYMLFPVLPGYAHSLKAGVLGVLPVTITFFLAAIIAGPIIGYFVDWKGRLRFAIAGAVANTMLTFAYAFLHSIALLVLVRLLHGIAFAAFSVAMLTILTDATENSWRADVVSAYFIPQLFWTAIGPAFSLFLFPFGGVKTVFVTAAILSLLGIIFTLFIRSPKIFSLNKQDFKTKDLLAFDNLLVLAASFVFNAVYSALLLNADSYITHVKGDAIAGFYAWFVIAGLLVMYNAGGLSDRIGRIKAVLIGFVFLIISLALVIFAESKSIASFSGIFFGVSYGLLIPSVTVWWMDIMPITKRGLFMGILQTVQALGLVIGLWILNIFGFFGPKGIFIAALLFTLTLSGLLVMQIKYENKKKDIKNPMF